MIYFSINYFSYTSLIHFNMESEEWSLEQIDGGVGLGDWSVLIRRLIPRDFEGVLEIDREVFGGYDPSIFTAFYEYYGKTTLVAESNGRVVGFILGFKHTPLEGRVFWLAVRPGFQSRGIGRRLLTAILSTFRQVGAVSATLEVRVSNKKAQALYSQMGFRVAGIYPSYYSDGEAAIVMERML